MGTRKFNPFGATRPTGKRWKQLFYMALDRQGPYCRHCKKLNYGLQLDHVVPIARGGDHTDSNVQLLCVTCHKKKTASEATKRSKAKVRDNRTPMEVEWDNYIGVNHD